MSLENTQMFEARIQTRKDTSANWTQYNPVLLDGEEILVVTSSGEIRRKIGDGVKTYTQLPFTDENLRALISEQDINMKDSTGENSLVGNDIDNNQAISAYSTALGNGTTASGEAAHAEGKEVTAEGDYAHAEGYKTLSADQGSHAEGIETTASGTAAHAEGKKSQAPGNYSHAEGYDTTAITEASKAGGYQTIAGGRGFRITAIDHEASTVILEGYNDYITTYPNKTLAIDDTYTMRLNDNYDKQGVITAIDGDVITVTNLPEADLIPEKEYFIKGTWLWNEILDEVMLDATDTQFNPVSINFEFEQDGGRVSADGLGLGGGPFNVWYYDSSITNPMQSPIANYNTYMEIDENGDGVPDGWYGSMDCRTMYFGDEPQAIPVSYYEIFSTQATPQDGGELIVQINELDSDVNTFRVLDKPLVGNIDIAIAATAEGSGTKALGNYSHAEGYKTEAYGAYSHAEGNETVAGHAAHAQGYLTKALGNYSMAAGYKTQAGSMGYRITAINMGLDGNLELTVGDDVNLEPLSDLFAQGTIDKGILRLKSYYENLTIVNISNSYKQIIVTPIVTDGQDSETGAAGGAPKLSGGTGDQDTFRIGNHPEIGSELLTHYGTALGHSTQANGPFAYAEGYLAVAGGKYSHAEGKSTYAGFGAHAEGENTKALVFDSHAEGQNSTAKERAAHAEGQTTSAEAEGAHSEGGWTKAKGKFSHVEGYHAYAEGTAAHAEGYQKGVHAEKGENYGAYGQGAHVEGECTFAIGAGAHAEGGYTTALQEYSHAEGRETKAEVGWGAHAEGYRTLATGDDAHAEGRSTIAKGSHSHAEGELTIATGSHSHAEGEAAQALGETSHAEGCSTFAGTYGYKITNFTVNPPSVTISAGEETSFINFKVDNSVTELSYLIPTSKSTWGANPSPEWHTRYADKNNVIIYKFPLENCQSKYIKLSLTIGREYWLRAELMTSEALNARFWDEKQGTLYYTVTQENRTQLINNSTEIDSDPSGYYVQPTTAKTFNIDLTQVKGYDKDNFTSQYLLIYILDINEKTGNGGAIRIDSNVTCSYVSSPTDLDIGDQLQIKLIKNYYIGKLDSSNGPILYLTPSAEIDFSKEPNQVDYSGNNCSLNIIGEPLNGNIIISNPCAHAEGFETIATGYAAHAEGVATTSSGYAAHAEGNGTLAEGLYSHAEGSGCTAKGENSHAGGFHTIASGAAQMAIGKYNIEDTADEYAFIIGNGTSDTNRKNAFAIKKDGSITIGSTTITEEQLKKLLTLLDYTEYTGGIV